MKFRYMIETLDIKDKFGPNIILFFIKSTILKTHDIVTCNVLNLGQVDVVNDSMCISLNYK